jgi:hypothetical protein
MGWILRFAATIAGFVAGAVVLACVAMCKISQCQLD